MAVIDEIVCKSKLFSRTIRTQGVNVTSSVLLSGRVGYHER